MDEGSRGRVLRRWLKLMTISSSNNIIRIARGLGLVSGKGEAGRRSGSVELWAGKIATLPGDKTVSTGAGKVEVLKTKTVAALPESEASSPTKEKAGIS